MCNLRWQAGLALMVISTSYSASKEEQEEQEALHLDYIRDVIQL